MAPTTPLLVEIDGHAKHGFYRELGLSVKLKDDEHTSLGNPIIVCDREGNCSLHEVIGILRPAGVRRMQLGPQIEWPSGGKDLRQIENYL